MIMTFKKNTLVLGLTGALLMSMLPLQAYAHRSWLLPSGTQIEGKEPWVTIDAAVSENLFDFDTTALKLDGLTVAGPDGKGIKPENQFSSRLRNGFDLKLEQPGTYRISLVNVAVMASYKLNGENKRWRGTEEAFTKEIPANAEDVQATRMHSRVETFVSAGKPNATVLKPAGVGLELVPVTHPNDLMAGQKAQFRFLLDGKPAANLSFSVIPGGVRYRGVLKEMTITTDAKGEFSVTWPEAGMYAISASYPPRAQPVANAQPAQPPAMPARRVSYSGTFEVMPQ